MSDSSSKDAWDKYKITMESAIPAVVLVWAVLSWLLVANYQEKASERQAQANIEALQSQRAISGAQIAAGLVGSLAKGTVIERQSALVILASAAPDLARSVSSALERTATTRAEREQSQKLAEQISELSAEAKADQDFLHHLQDARVFQRYQLHGQADREYIAASHHVPSRFKVDPEKINEAKLHYDNGEFDAAAKTFEEAFQGISTQ
jgi:tetratricopeptide (TPR) repeat protein